MRDTWVMSSVSVVGLLETPKERKSCALIMFGKCNHAPVSSSSCHRLGFLQKNNSLEERSRIVSSFKERTAKNLLSCDNNGAGEARFRRTETDFSNLFARGKKQVNDQLTLIDDAINTKYD